MTGNDPVRPGACRRAGNHHTNIQAPLPRTRAKVVLRPSPATGHAAEILDV
jgi:hypothetical protein